MIKIIQSLLMTTVILFSSQLVAESKRVFVFKLPQQYWDVKKGDTLNGIAEALLPNDKQQQKALSHAIFSMNTSAFINGNPDRLLFNERLWLPGSGLQTHQPLSSGNKGSSENFSWGSITRDK